MKKVLLILGVVGLFAFASCGSDDDKEESKTQTAQQQGKSAADKYCNCLKNAGQNENAIMNCSTATMSDLFSHMSDSVYMKGYEEGMNNCSYSKK